MIRSKISAGKLYRRVELLMNSVHISDSMLLTTALLAALHYLSSQESCKVGKD